MSQFAPTPLHGAAYAVAIEAVGGLSAIGSCSTWDEYQALLAKLDELRAFAITQDATVYTAYQWGTQRVQEDAKGRLDIYENNRKVNAALAGLPRPPTHP